MKVGDTIIITECLANPFFSVGDIGVLIRCDTDDSTWEADFSVTQTPDYHRNHWWIVGHDVKFELYPPADTVSEVIEL